MAEDTATGKTIDEVTPDTEIGGSEKFPISDAGVPKSVTAEKIKDYVIDAITLITAASSSDFDIDSDKIYIKNGNDLKPIAAADVAEAVCAKLFDRSAAGELADTDVISVETSGGIKTVSLFEIAVYVEDNISYEFNIDSLSSVNAIHYNDNFAISERSSGQNKKINFGNLWEVIKQMLGAVTEQTSAIGADQSILIGTGRYDSYVKRVKLSNAGIGTGDVKGAALSAVTNENIAVWDKPSGATEKKLKNGPAVLAGGQSASTLSNTSTDQQVPTARNAYLAVKAVDDKTVDGPSANTDGYIPQWNGTDSKTLKNGVGLVTSTGTDYEDEAHVYSTLAVVKGWDLRQGRARVHTNINKNLVENIQELGGETASRGFWEIIYYDGVRKLAIVYHSEAGDWYKIADLNNLNRIDIPAT